MEVNMKGDAFNKIFKFILVIVLCMTVLSAYCFTRDKSYEKYEDGINEVTYSLTITRDGEYKTKKESEEFKKLNNEPSWKAEYEKSQKR